MFSGTLHIFLLLELSKRIKAFTLARMQLEGIHVKTFSIFLSTKG